jgi:hypothetical protein
MGEIDKINELPESDELPPANEDSAEYKAGSRLAKRVNRATEKRWIGIVDGPTHRSRHTLIWRDGPPRSTSPKSGLLETISDIP